MFKRGQPCYCTCHKCVARFISDSRVCCLLTNSSLACLQAARKLAIAEVTLESFESRLEAAESYVSVFITSAEEVMYSSALVFVCLLAGLRKNYSTDSHTKFGGKVAYVARKKYLAFGGNPYRVTLGSGLGLGFRIQVRSGQLYTPGSNHTCDTRIIAGMARPPPICFTRCLFKSKNFAGSAALAEVCALLSAVLVHWTRQGQVVWTWTFSVAVFAQYVSLRKSKCGDGQSKSSPVRPLPGFT